jgi:hypothetical protein
MGKKQEVVLTWLKFEKLFNDIFAQLSRPLTILTTANMKNQTIFAVVSFELKLISETLILKF